MPEPPTPDESGWYWINSQFGWSMSYLDVERERLVLVTPSGRSLKFSAPYPVEEWYGPIRCPRDCSVVIESRELRKEAKARGLSMSIMFACSHYDVTATGRYRLMSEDVKEFADLARSIV